MLAERAPRDAARRPRAPSTSATARSSPAATCSSSPRRRRPPRSAAGAARSSRAPRARSSACARTRASRRWGRRDRARAPAARPARRRRLAADARPRHRRAGAGRPRAPGARAPRRAAPGCRRRLVPALVAVLVVLLALRRRCSRPRRASARRCATGSASARCASRASRACPTSRRPAKLELGRRATVAQANRAPRQPDRDGPRARRARRDLPRRRPARARVGGLRRATRACPPGTAGVGALLDQLQGDATAFVEKFVAGGVPITRVRRQRRARVLHRRPARGQPPRRAAPAPGGQHAWCGCTTP